MAKKTPLTAQRQASGQDINLAFIRAKVDQILLLLEASAMTEEVKTAWVTLLPQMSLAQVDRLVGLLEEELTLTLEYAKKHPEDEELLLKLKTVKDRYAVKAGETNSRALAQLSNIEAQLITYTQTAG